MPQINYLFVSQEKPGNLIGRPLQIGQMYLDHKKGKFGFFVGYVEIENISYKILVSPEACKYAHDQIEKGSKFVYEAKMNVIEEKHFLSELITKILPENLKNYISEKTKTLSPEF